jgi:hypothetical protein
MFFIISSIDHAQLPETHRVGKWHISTDKGWKANRGSGSVRLEKYLGDFGCTITCDGQDWQIHTREMRRFPLWTSESGDTVSNIIVTGKQIHNPHVVAHKDGRLDVDYQDRPDHCVPGQVISRKTAEDLLCDNLIKQAEQLSESRRALDGVPIIAPVSKGVDCALVRAVLDYAQVPYTSHRITKNTLGSTPALKSLLNSAGSPFWGYRQIVDEGDRHIQATGFNGDEYMSRNPLYVAMYTKRWNIDIVEEFDRAGPSYMRNFFDQHYREKISRFDFPEDPLSQLSDMLINDLQMWHMDDCFTWTPFADPDFLKICLSIDADTAVDQCLNAGLSRSLIKSLNPSRIEEIQTNKNGRLPL